MIVIRQTLMGVKKKQVEEYNVEDTHNTVEDTHKTKVKLLKSDILKEVYKSKFVLPQLRTVKFGLKKKKL